MPPYVSRKRPSVEPPPVENLPTRKQRRANSVKPVIKANILNPASALEDNKTFLETLDSTDDDNSLSSVDTDVFEDVLPVVAPSPSNSRSDEENDIAWEDAISPNHPSLASRCTAHETSDLEITLNDGSAHKSETITSNSKKAPSKIEREIRLSVHCMHVQCLLFHNLVRNGWACDGKAQEILVSQVPPSVSTQWKKWQQASGLSPVSTSSQGKRNSGVAVKAVHKRRGQREWNKPALEQQNGNADESHSDPSIRFLKVLAAYWRKRFVVNASGLRKQGYKPLHVLEKELASWKRKASKARSDGEVVGDLDTFRERAQSCEGSRDLSSQLFLTLTRGLGFEARLVASLQPLGYGWATSENATGKDIESRSEDTTAEQNSDQSQPGESVHPESASNSPHIAPSSSSKKAQAERPRKSLLNGRNKHKPINIDKSSEESPTVDESVDSSEPDADSDSIVDITPQFPNPRRRTKHDRDMPSPSYWVEVISPTTNQVYPVDPLSLSHPVATKYEHFGQFEPRGLRADKAKQVFAYVVSYSKDGTAKEVTTRYLKRRTWPGRTKGVRLPVQKVPVFDRKGKVKRYEHYDWFKRVMSCYERPHHSRTTVDDIEDAKDLEPAKQATKRTGVSEDSLQAYKSSSTFVLERHLRREEALRPNAEPVRMFKSGKGEKQKDEPVFLREDVEICRTAESWHKEGRGVKVDEVPMKSVPVRAVTVNRKREVEEAQREGGGKLMQGMYAKHQTDWIIPPPIRDGIIPKNAYGNMDCFVPSMVPQGAVHVPLRQTVKICRRLEIDFAEAVTGFEFGHRIAVPVISGVVVAECNGKAVISEWDKDEEERRIKESGKRERQALAMWRKLLLGLRVLQRVDEEYGEQALATARDEVNPFVNQRKAGRKRNDSESISHSQSSVEDTALSGGGGFLLENKDTTDSTLGNNLRQAFNRSSTSLPQALEESHSGNMQHPFKEDMTATSDPKEALNNVKQVQPANKKEKRSKKNGASRPRMEQKTARKGVQTDVPSSSRRRSTRQSAVKTTKSYADEEIESEDGSEPFSNLGEH